ncbi:hypothetical protein GW17_00016714 [Ensete ventricosum]|nr:hypothetical protein GW17_00016714 [Ensete ventricosum]RZS12876.1 hypothetical protein BHM03_00044388 [Ensete ventricosum]
MVIRGRTVMRWLVIRSGSRETVEQRRRKTCSGRRLHAGDKQPHSVTPLLQSNTTVKKAPPFCSLLSE